MLLFSAIASDLSTMKKANIHTFWIRIPLPFPCLFPIRIDLLFDPAITLLVSEEIQNTNLKEHKHLYIHCSIIYNCQDMEAAQVSILRWVEKTTVQHLYNGILAGYKKEENFTFCNSMERPREHYAKWNKPVRERQIPYDFTHMWNLMNKLD